MSSTALMYTDPVTGQFDAVGGNGTGNALNTQEQAAMGFDPSTGRTPVEQVNNYANTGTLAATVSLVVKAAPGFLHKVILAAGTALQFEIHDHATAASNLVFRSGSAAVTPTMPMVIEVNMLMTAGIVIKNSHATVAHAAGDVTLVYR